MKTPLHSDPAASGARPEDVTTSDGVLEGLRSMTPEEVRRKRFRIRRFRRGINADEVYEYLGVVAAAIDAALAEARAARVEKDRVTEGLRRWQSQFTPDPTTHQPIPTAVPRHAVFEKATRSPAWSVATASYPASGRYRVQSHE